MASGHWHSITSITSSPQTKSIVTQSVLKTKGSQDEFWRIAHHLCAGRSAAEGATNKLAAGTKRCRLYALLPCSLAKSRGHRRFADAAPGGTAEESEVNSLHSHILGEIDQGFRLYWWAFVQAAYDPCLCWISKWMIIEPIIHICEGTCKQDRTTTGFCFMRYINIDKRMGWIESKCWYLKGEIWQLL